MLINKVNKSLLFGGMTIDLYVKGTIEATQWPRQPHCLRLYVLALKRFNQRSEMRVEKRKEAQQEL